MLMTTPAKMKMRMMTMTSRMMTAIIAWEERGDGKGRSEENEAVAMGRGNVKRMRQ